MARLRWTRDRHWVDTANEVEAHEPGVYEVPDAVAAAYCNHPIEGWERVDGDTAAEGEDTTGEASETYPRDELESWSYNELRTLASEADREDVDGRSSKADIIDAFAEDE